MVEEISNCEEMLGIGQTGDMNAPLIPGKSDIDLFIICKKVPNADRRLSLYQSFDALYEIVSDPETMQHYSAPFDEERTKGWITWNLENYEKYGFGLWAVVLKETRDFIGDCGISIQNIDGEMLPEIGYHIHKRDWRKGLGKEAARAARDWVFEHTDYDIVYSYMKYTNIGSYRTAIANGMKKVKEYPDPKNTISYAYAITREEWERIVISKSL